MGEGDWRVGEVRSHSWRSGGIGGTVVEGYGGGFGIGTEKVSCMSGEQE